MRAFVTGATGFIGRHLIAELVRRDWEVKALARNPARLRAVERVTIIKGDVRDACALAQGVQDTDVVFHLAATIAGPWELHESTTVAGTRALLRQCQSANVCRFVLASSLAVYDKRGVSADSIIDEDWPVLEGTCAAGSYARAKVAAEAITRAYHSAHLQTTIIRLGLVYGSERLVFPHLGELVGRQRWAFGTASLRLPLIEMGSAVEALIAAASSSRTGGGTYQAVDTEQITRGDYLDMLAEMTGHPHRTRYVPVGPVALMCEVIARARRLPGLQRLPDVSGEKIRQRSIEPRYDASRLRRETAWRGGPSVREGLSAALRLPPTREPAAVERVGLIGAGRIAHLHVQALRRMKHVAIVGILDRDAEAAHRFGAATNLTSFADAETFYREARPQIVHVLTPPASHAPVAFDALNHGAHVVLEKPAVSTLTQCDELIAAAEARNLTIGVDENVAWDPLVRQACALLQDGVLGELLHIDIFMGFDLQRAKLNASANGAAIAWTLQLPGGVLEDLLPHPLSVAKALLGNEITMLHHQSRSSGRNPLDIPDELRIACSARTGATAHIAVSLSARPDDFLVGVYGSRASVRIDLQNMLLDSLTPVPGPRVLARGVRTLRTGLRSLNQTAKNAAMIAFGRALPPASPFYLLQAHYSALASGRPLPASLRNARSMIEFARTIWPEAAVSTERPLREGSMHGARAQTLDEANGRADQMPRSA